MGVVYYRCQGRYPVVNAAGRDGRGLCLRERNDQIATMLQRGCDRGEPSPALPQVIDHLVAPLYFRVLFGIQPTDDAYAQAPDAPSARALRDGGRSRL